MLIALAGLMLASCTPKVYMQIVDVKSTSVPKDGPNYAYNDGKVKVTYNFWDSYGDAGFVIENLTEDLLYVNMNESFYNSNGWSNDYFRNATYSKTTAYRYYGSYRPTSVGSITKTIDVPGQTVTTSEKEVIILPPHTARKVTVYAVLSDLLEDCSVKMYPSKKRPEGKSYSESDSPVKFSNFLTYKVGQNGAPVHVTNAFYIAGFKNYNYKEISGLEKYGCNGQFSKSVITLSEPTKFYIRYMTHSNINSADAKAAYKYLVK